MSEPDERPARERARRVVLLEGQADHPPQRERDQRQGEQDGRGKTEDLEEPASLAERHFPLGIALAIPSRSFWSAARAVSRFSFSNRYGDRRSAMAL